MEKVLVKGQKVKLEELAVGSTFEAGLSCRISGASPDISCFGIDADGRLSDDRYFIFYNQRRSPEGAIEARGPSGNYDERFAVDLAKLPASIVRLVFVATIDGSATFAALSSGRFDLIVAGDSAASYRLAGSDFSAEKAVIIGEVYLKTVWRLAAVGQGFNGGLSALLKHFGGEEISVPAPAPEPDPAPAEPKVSLSKVRLDKQGEKHKISLSKDSGPQVFHINLQWDQPSASGGGFLGRLLGGSKGGADLDLGCMWRDRQGNQGVIQPLGNRFGSQHSVPYILLDKDDRSGEAADGENMRIYRPDTLAVVLVFAMIYEGTANFTDVNARLTIFDGRGGEILIPLNAPDPRRTFCAVATIINDGGSIQVSKEERYFQGHQDCDQRYGFGFRWVAGKK
jgi:tellurite resistance protein TerA